MNNKIATTVAGLWRYPVKSMIGEELNTSFITKNGVLGDRAFALLDNETGHVVSAKNPKKWPDLFSYHAGYTAQPNHGETVLNFLTSVSQYNFSRILRHS